MSQQRSNSIFKDDVERQDRPSLLAVFQELFNFDGSPSSPRRKRLNGAVDNKQRRTSNPQAPQRASLVSVEENPLTEEQRAASRDSAGAWTVRKRDGCIAERCAEDV